jgi:FAD/FMN-containing dehydrogenase/Fe-S oxidoreductase
MPIDSASFPRELANAIEGEVRFGHHDRMLYATDASLFQVEPLGVVIPKDIDDGLRALTLCHRHGTPVLPRGGGTSLAGQCTNNAVVIDWSANCRGWRDLDAAGRTVYAQPGLTIDDLNDAIAASGLFFAPDPATSRHATIGGCIGNNAAGARSILYGRTSENLAAIDAALADGTRLRLAPNSGATDPRAAALCTAVADITRRHQRLIRERFPRTIRRNAGYALDMILQQLDAGAAPHALDLAPLLCGSEGTLALTLGATLKLHPRPKVKCLAVLGFADLDEAIAAVPAILTTRPSAVEMLDDMILNLARANNEYRAYADLMPPAPGGSPPQAVLYVEYFAASRDELDSRLAALGALRLRSTSHVHHDQAAMLSAWKLRKAGEPLLHGVPGARKPITFIEDNAIPVERLSEFVRRLRAIVTRHGTIASYWAHASVGVLHVRPLLDIHSERDRETMRSIAVETADLARELGGVMSGEHGDGRVRGPLLERFFGPELLGAFREVKRLFDPKNILNPGNIVDLSGDNPRPIESMTASLRVQPTPQRPLAFPPGIETFFNYHDQHGFDSAVEMCNGAGVCRKKQGGTMCPSYMATLDERHSTRGRGNALRLAITGQFATGSDAPSQDIWSDPETIGTLDLCLSCKACKTECPSNVDIARLKAEYTAQRFRLRGAPLPTKIIGSVRTLNKLGSLLPALANWFNRQAPARSLINTVFSFHPRRTLPDFSTPLPRRWKTHAAGAAPAVVLFGDCFCMYNESSIGLAIRRVYEAFGYRVLLADAGCCARPKISLGLLPEAIDEADATLARLRPHIDDPNVRAILVAEPSCLSAFKDDWLALKLRTPIDVRKALAKKAFLPEHFLDDHWDQHPRRPVFRAPSNDVLLHGHCHQKALWGAHTSSKLLARIAGEKLKTLDTGCCGMCGSFGFGKDRFEISMKIAELTLLPSIRNSSENAAIAAPGTSCRHQIHDGSGRTARHPMEWVADWLRS